MNSNWQPTRVQLAETIDFNRLTYANAEAVQSARVRQVQWSETQRWIALLPKSTGGPARMEPG